MSRGLTFALDQLPAHMQAQAREKLARTQEKLASVGTVREGVCEDDKKPSERKPRARGETIEYNGERMTVTQWAARLGISKQAFNSRLSRWPESRVFEKATKRKPRIPKLSEPEERLAFHLKAEGVGGFVRQYFWCPGRKYRADFAWIPAKLLIEVQGGVFKNGAHTRGRGYEYDRQRNNEAMILGWRVLEFTPSQIKSGKAIHSIKRALEGFRT